MPRMRLRFRNTATTSIYYGVRILVFLAAGMFALRGEWSTFASTLFIIALMMIPTIMRRFSRVRLPFSIDLGIVVFIFLTLFLGQVGHLYSYISFWDKFVHFQSGLLLGASGFTVVYALRSRGRASLVMSPLFVALFSVVFSLAIGALWEIGEFFWDMALNRSTQASLDDTMWDLIANLLGSIVISVAGSLWLRRYERMPFSADTESE